MQSVFVKTKDELFVISFANLVCDLFPLGSWHDRRSVLSWTSEIYSRFSEIHLCLWVWRYYHSEPCSKQSELGQMGYIKINSSDPLTQFTRLKTELILDWIWMTQGEIAHSLWVNSDFLSLTQLDSKSLEGDDDHSWRLFSCSNSTD
jgi:hypothetical protein